MESIKATMLSVRYRSPEHNWLVAQMKHDGKKAGTFIATGDIPYSETEEPVQLYGEWAEDAKYGKQFKVSISHRILPTSIAGLRNYLAASEDIPGIGPVRANKLAASFGSDLLSILDSANETLLATCDGISTELAGRIIAGWKRDSAIRQLSFYLAEHGVSPRWAARILKHWDANTAIQRISHNPYTLMVIEGIGFATADLIAKALGFPDDSPHRMQAACSHILAEGVKDGNVFLHEGELISGVVHLIRPRTKNTDVLSKAEEGAREALDRAIQAKEVVVEEVSDGVTALKLIYLPWLYKAEKALAEVLGEIATTKPSPIKDLDRVIKQVEEASHVAFSKQQVDAIRGAFSNNIVVITGGPGTGKTTCVRAICEAATQLHLDTLSLVAPTGRAAKRLSEVTSLPASTIHRLLKWQNGQPIHDAGNPIEADVLIVDECSMLDLDLAVKLFSAVGPKTRVILIGDSDQLPAIGAGSVLTDIIHSKRIPTIVLETIFRQAESSLIIRNAHFIRKGEMPRFPDKGSRSDDHFVMWIPPAGAGAEGGRDDSGWLDRKLRQVVCTNIPTRFNDLNKKIDPIRDIQVLVPMKKHTLGSHALNKILQNALNPNGFEFFVGGKAFKYGDRVMQMRNNYEEGMEIYNGDIGFITSHSTEDKTIQVEFYGRKVDYPFEDVDDLTLAYAQTIHKSQGSEYPIVIVIMGFQHWPMLERNLLYTATTRAKNLCLFMASKGAIERAVKNNPVRNRNTYLAQRIRLCLSKE